MQDRSIYVYSIYIPDSSGLKSKLGFNINKEKFDEVKFDVYKNNLFVPNLESL